jgi:hypothetical protein
MRAFEKGCYCYLGAQMPNAIREIKKAANKLDAFIVWLLWIGSKPLLDICALSL